MNHSIKRTFLQLIVVLLIAGAAEASGEKSDGAVLKETLFQAFNLALLLGVLFYFGRKPIAEFFSTRRGSQAAELLAQAEKRNSELQRRLVSLGSDIEGIRDESARRAEQEAERILNDARDAAERIRRDAQAGVAQELRRAQADLREEAAELALEIAARKLAENVGDADRDRLVDEFILRVEPDAGEGRNG